MVQGGKSFHTEKSYKIDVIFFMVKKSIVKLFKAIFGWNNSCANFIYLSIELWVIRASFP